MPTSSRTAGADRGQRRATFQRSNSRETKRVLVQAAMALWRTNGYANTTVAQICGAAGVSKALFYFYFPRKEDVLFEVGVMSTRSAQRTIAELVEGDYDVQTVIDAALTDLERSMARNPRELVVETILEGYRHEHRILSAADGTDDTGTAAGPDLDGGMFTGLFERALADGKLPDDTDAGHLAYLAMTLVSEGARHWAAGSFGAQSFADVVGADIATLIAGTNSQRRP